MRKNILRKGVAQKLRNALHTLFSLQNMLNFVLSDACADGN